MVKTVVILQPGYLPWLGFFEQMARSDIFVIYDDAQYDKNGWRNRNRIKTPTGTIWLTVPVHASITSKIFEVTIDKNQNWQKKHLNSLKLNYSKAPYFNSCWSVFERVLSQSWEKLVDLDIAFIYEINKILGLEKRIEFSSRLNITGERITRLIDICKHFGARTFYEGQAGKDYIDEKRFNDAGIKLEFQDYEHPVYNQLWGGFISHLSIVDLIFNEGPKSREILLKQ